MGAQSSLQGLVGTVGAAAAAVGSMAGKNAEKKRQNEENLDFSKAELAQAQAQAAETGLKKQEGEKLVGEKQAAYDAAMARRPGGKGNTKAKIAEAQKQALDDLTAAQRAFDVLSKKDTAARAMEAR